MQRAKPHLRMLAPHIPSMTTDLIPQPAHSDTEEMSPKWEVYRFELVFLNSKENRWQLFQELPQLQDVRPKAQGVYGRQIYLMLRNVRSFFLKALNVENLSTVFRYDSAPEGQTALSLNGLKKSLEFLGGND